MTKMQQLHTKDLTPRTIMLSICLFVLATTGIMAVVVRAMTGSASTGAVKSTRQTNSQSTFASTPETKAKTYITLKEPDYSVIVKRNLFRPLGTTIAVPPPPAPSVHVVKPPPPLTGPWTMAAVTKPATTPAPQVAFTGLVDIGGEHYALLESLEDHLSQYTRVGSTAFGYKLVTVADRSVTLELNGESIILNIGDNKEEVVIGMPAAPAPATANSQGGPNPQGGMINNGNGAQNGIGPGGNPNGGFRRRQREQTTAGEG